jgi:biopolymer transport protein ExbD
MPRPWYEKTLERTHKRHSRIMALADLSPVVDILFILAVTLFVCSGLVYRPGVSLSLPKYSEPDSIRGEVMTLTLTKEGDLYAEGDDLAPVGKERALELMERFRKNCPRGTVLIMADENARQKDMAELLKLIREAGIRKAAYATSQK